MSAPVFLSVPSSSWRGKSGGGLFSSLAAAAPLSHPRQTRAIRDPGPASPSGPAALVLSDCGASVLGLEKRIRDEMQIEDLSVRPGEVPAVKPENQDGGMPRHWWKPGLARQRGQK